MLDRGMPPMSYPPLDVLAIGNAIVDVIATTDEAFLGSEGLVKGSMRLIDAEEATRLYGRMAPGRETSGGSAANTAAGVAALGCRAGDRKSTRLNSSNSCASRMP